jgi:hypothetical protein
MTDQILYVWMQVTSDDVDPLEGEGLGMPERGGER